MSCFSHCVVICHHSVDWLRLLVWLPDVSFINWHFSLFSFLGLRFPLFAVELSTLKLMLDVMSCCLVKVKWLEQPKMHLVYLSHRSTRWKTIFSFFSRRWFIHATTERHVGHIINALKTSDESGAWATKIKEISCRLFDSFSSFGFSVDLESCQRHCKSAETENCHILPLFYFRHWEAQIE